MILLVRDSDLVDMDGASMASDATGRRSVNSAAVRIPPPPVLGDDDIVRLQIVSTLRKFFLNQPHKYFTPAQLVCARGSRSTDRLSLRSQTRFVSCRDRMR